MKFRLLTFLLLSLSCCVVNAATFTATNQTVAAIQALINSANNGDTVVIPPGAVTWTTALNITKGITLDGTGVTVTRGNVTGGILNITTTAAAATRLTGFNFIDNANDYTMFVNGSYSNPKFRIDHCTFTSTTIPTFITTSTVWGVIDNCIFTAEASAEMIHNVAWGPSSTAGWSDTVVPGSIDALYVETCTFNKTTQNDPYFWGTAAIQSYYGARTVFRYNICNYVHVDQHGTPGNIGARWWEIYENTFNVPTTQANISNFIAIRAGSGVIFNNRIRGGYNSGAGTIELFEEDTGYPALYQIGRGKDQVLDPAYCWNNDYRAGAGSSNVVDGRDMYSNTVKPGYTPLAYPHPLAITTTAPPTNARVLISTP